MSEATKTNTTTRAVTHLVSIIEADYPRGSDDPVARKAVKDSLEALAKTPSQTLRECGGKARIFRLIPSDDLADSLAEDVLKLTGGAN